jgi:hypothetical protein
VETRQGKIDEKGADGNADQQLAIPFQAVTILHNNAPGEGHTLEHITAAK